MTTPLDEGQNPDDLGDRPAVDLGDYPEFFAYGGARGADAKPASGGAQPGSYQGYEDYFRRPPEPEPPVRSRSGGSALEDDDADEQEGPAGAGSGPARAGGVGGSARAGAGRSGGAGGPAGGAGHADPSGNFTPGAASGSFAADPFNADPFNADPFAGGPYAADPFAAETGTSRTPADEPPLRSRRGQGSAEASATGRMPRLRRSGGAAPSGAAPSGAAPSGAAGSAAPTTGPAAGAPSRSRGQQVPAPRVEPDHSSFGPAAWDSANSAHGAAEASARTPFGQQPPAAPLYEPAAAPDFPRTPASPTAPPHPDSRIAFPGEPAPAPDYTRAPFPPAAPPQSDPRMAFTGRSAVAPPPHPDTRIPFPDEPAPNYDYRVAAPDSAFPQAPAARDRDYRAAYPATETAEPSGAPRSRRGLPDSTPEYPDASAQSGAAAAHRLSQGPGRRRAKRSLASYLWPFRALTAQPLTSTRIRSRSTAATVWRRLKADRLALAGAVTIVVLIGLAVFANVIDAILGVDPTTLHPGLTDPILGPHGSFGGMSLDHPLGVDPSLGRDVLARLLSGARVSLLVAFSSTLLAVGVGSALGVVAGYVGGRVDAVITRLADLFLAFPLFLFALGLTGALSDRAFGLSGNGLRIAVMVFVMGFFNWPYIARIVRAEVLSLREREFIDAARALGARRRWIIGRELMPNLLSPILVYATLLIPTNIIFEAGLSALGIGLNPPAASWGQMMLDASRTVYTDPAYLIVPGMAVFITVLAFNLFGDGLRDALDPTAQ